MIVGKVILSGGRRTMRFDPGAAGLLYAATSECTRAAFAGKTAEGRSGIALHIPTGRVTGHKIDPIPTTLPRLVRQIAKSSARDGLRFAAGGEDVLIGTLENGLVIKWLGDGFEVFGAGDDSHS